jgi:hypothetical protein
LSGWGSEEVLASVGDGVFFESGVAECCRVRLRRGLTGDRCCWHPNRGHCLGWTDSSFPGCQSTSTRSLRHLKIDLSMSSKDRRWLNMSATMTTICSSVFGGHQPASVICNFSPTIFAVFGVPFRCRRCIQDGEI